MIGAIFSMVGWHSPHLLCADRKGEIRSPGTLNLYSINCSSSKVRFAQSLQVPLTRYYLGLQYISGS